MFAAVAFVAAPGCFAATVEPADAGTTMVDASAPRDAGSALAPDAPMAAADASLSLPCGPGIAPYVGGLPCIDAPCAVVSSQVFEPLGCGNERPHVLVRPDGEPEIYFEASALGAGSFHARRAAGTWRVTTVSPFIQSAFVLDAAGCGYAWLSGRMEATPITTGLYAIDGDRFTLLRAVERTYVHEGGLVLDAAGGLHALVERDPPSASIDITPSSWIETPLPGARDYVIGAAIAVGPDLSVHRVWEDASRPGLFFYDHGGPSVPVLPSAPASPMEIATPLVELALSGATGPGRPRILVSDFPATTLYLAVRDDPSIPFDATEITGPATPIGVVAADDGDAVGVATHGRWESGAGLFVVTFHDGVVGTIDLGVDVHPYASSAAFGANGHLHIAVCANDDGKMHYYEVASMP